MPESWIGDGYCDSEDQPFGVDLTCYANDGGDCPAQHGDINNDGFINVSDIIILIDSPDFNHRVAKKIKRYLPDIPIICYVAPTVWAWRHGRAKKMSKYFNYLLSVIPFEVNFFEKYGLKTTYVGHPFIEKVKKIDDKNFSNQLDLLNGDKTIIFLPGSRRSEIERHSPIMSQAIEYLRSQDLKINILIATGHKQLNQIREYFPDIKVITDDNEKYSLFKIADFACAASGTVTLELGLTETPTIVIYKMDKFTWFFISLNSYFK